MTTRHPAFRQYAPFGPHQNVNMGKNVHKARDLLNHTVIAFHTRSDRDLSEVQIEARDKFVVMFKKQKQAYGGQVKLDASMKKVMDQRLNDVKAFFTFLDEFFFFGQLGSHVELNVGIDCVGKDPMGFDDRIEGETYPAKKRDEESTIIKLNIGSKGKLCTLDVIIGQLMHEMVHAYFQVFACDCAQCNKNVLNTVGIKNDAHGPLFLILHRLILTEMRTWGGRSSGLNSLLAKDCPRDFISKSAKSRATKAMQSLDPHKKAELYGYGQYVTSRTLLGLNADGDRVRVKDGLVEAQIKLEDALWIREERGRRFDDTEYYQSDSEWEEESITTDNSFETNHENEDLMERVRGKAKSV
ncbi:uncharacterized protein F4822DRAFT_428441 [Hypoxylon trugodes]|uniref:uncharacterized protein n=1 Tax=Hypoxylon trugodes TaxID=326681 RepID=UPI0021934AFC|nr:uncharacterized protein F4822DRAFT_428441 [Hypoxylon trugodes]KAI1390098.1 hypothetical protein F4822DRAFT_428441 [Hypoxylon trugodes]